MPPDEILKSSDFPTPVRMGTQQAQQQTAEKYNRLQDFQSRFKPALFAPATSESLPASAQNCPRPTLNYTVSPMPTLNPVPNGQAPAQTPRSYAAVASAVNNTYPDAPARNRYNQSQSDLATKRYVQECIREETMKMQQHIDDLEAKIEELEEKISEKRTAR